MSAGKKEKIFEGVMRLAREGADLRLVTVQQIADAAGIGKGTLYEYFSSREEIIAATLMYAVDAELERVRARFDGLRRRVRIESPKGSRLVRDAPDFDRQDVSVELQPIVGLYLPVWRRVETLARTVSVPRSRTVSDACSQAQGAAEKIAKLNCPSGVEILDKWVDYSMIDDEFVYATVVLAFEEEIGTRGMPKAQIEP